MVHLYGQAGALQVGKFPRRRERRVERLRPRTGRLVQLHRDITNELINQLIRSRDCRLVQLHRDIMNESYIAEIYSRYMPAVQTAGLTRCQGEAVPASAPP